MSAFALSQRLAARMPKAWLSLLRQGLFYGLGLIMMRGVSLLMLPVFTAYLVPAEYGRLEVVLALASIATLLLSCGLSEALYRFAGLASDHFARVVVLKQVYLGSWLLALLGAVIGFVGAAQWAAWLPGHVTAYEVQLLTLAVAVEGCIGIPLAWLRMTDQAGRFFVMTTGKVLLQAGLSWYWLVQGMGVEGVLLAGAVSALLLAFWLAVEHTLHYGWRVDCRALPRMFAYGAPMMISGFAGFVLAGLDRWWLAASVGEAAMAPYALAAKLALACGILLQPFSLWWYPRRFMLLKQPDGLLRNAQGAVLGSVLSVLACAGVGLCAPLLISVLTPSDYHQANVFIPWLVVGMALKQIGELLNLGCYIDENSQLQMWLNLATAGLALLGYAMLIEPFGVLGALWAMLLCYGVRMLLFYTLSQRRLPLPYCLWPLYASGAVALLALWLGQQLPEWWL